ncbi:MAG TPA: cyanophycin synthetase, partial [Isosphaeraceae bacterium]
MEIRKILALRGPNIWANFPVLEAWVDLKDLKDTASNEVPGLNDRLMAWLPTMIEHRCSEGRRGGFFERLRRGTYPGHIMEHIALELQGLAGSPVGFGKARESSEEGVYRVVIRYHEEEVGRAALVAARDLFLAAVHGRPFDVAAAVRSLRDLLLKVRLGPSTGAIAEAARARGIPVRRLNAESLVQLGHGARQRRILAAETDRTGAIAESIAQDKELTRAILRAVGVPVPDGRPVADADDAWAAAQEIGVPVVVKPQDGNQGRGVATNLTTRAQVLAAHAHARAEGESVLVERFAPGDDYRLLVVDAHLVAASRREPAQVLGDGRSTVAGLVEQANADPRRGEEHATALSTLKLDAVALAVLAEQGYTPESIPPAGTRVLIRRNANLSTGGTAIDVTDEVHPEVAARAVDAAQAIGLDIAGIDMVAQRIDRPLEEQGGVVVEVNASPGLRMHLEPSEGPARPVAEAILASLFPEGQTGRIPLVAVTGVNGKTTVTRLIAHVLARAGLRVGMTCTDGIYIDGRRIDARDCSGPLSARDVLMNPKVEAAVLETARGGILRGGLGFDRCDVAVVTNIGAGDHLGISSVETLEQLAQVKQTIVEVVPPGGSAVLNAADPLVAAMAGRCKGSVIYFARGDGHPVLAKHRSAGGRAVFDRDGSIILAEGDREVALVSLGRVPLTLGGRIGFQVENVLAAVAAAWALEISREDVVAALEAFTADIQSVPCRFNVLEVGGATVIVDFGHNPSALEALIAAIDQFPSTRRIIVFSAAGDRRDEDILRQADQIGAAFDRVILFEDVSTLRGRPSGEVIALFRRGLASGRRVTDVSAAVQGQLAATDAALQALRPGDLLVLQVE